MTVDGGIEVVMTEVEGPGITDEGPAEETTDAEPEEKGLEVKTPSKSQYHLNRE